ncbi:hypothetical protein BN7_3979 [Wickerhamomyces ciferrii]|uniref:Uncharacterized protein n=1 Tax=Wickerhamomyces ciferrii (strain ATCC 14091 / BCRC 22168 / CBS 111 / JCM 3599 / NBRC 0793 / NRRL Y-1031 F-60-10) TaxID=1206466 RepID=K0KGV7_WICCF|nr:uncharacterized protein BN7_3979 [Wickerhamomyces ciferrii]CCH44415.1 hypothetical protein BN7_3979 [Wickerhamomyces ciferrii]
MSIKRSYSPSIDDIRQYNIKKQRILDDLDNLSLGNKTPRTNNPQPISTRDREFIPDIDDFLVHNQDDQDILESSSEVLDLEHYNNSQLLIPKSLTKLNKISYNDAKFSFERILNRKKFNQKLEGFQGNLQISNDDILWDNEILKFWSLIKYWEPNLMIYQIWEVWYFNVYKLNQFDEEFQSRIEMLPDDYPVDQNHPMEDQEDQDLMIDDIYELNEFNEKPKQEYNYNETYEPTPYIEEVQSMDPEDSMDID